MIDCFGELPIYADSLNLVLSLSQNILKIDIEFYIFYNRYFANHVVLIVGKVRYKIPHIISHAHRSNPELLFFENIPQNTRKYFSFAT